MKSTEIAIAIDEKVILRHANALVDGGVTRTGRAPATAAQGQRPDDLLLAVMRRGISIVAALLDQAMSQEVDCSGSY
jgi:hypothetical protein